MSQPRTRSLVSRTLLLLGAILIAWVPPRAIAVVGAEPRREGADQAGDNGPPTSTADLKALERKIRAAVERVAPSVVAISGGGSGVVVSEDGYVLTVAHLGVQAGRSITLTFPDGKRVKGKTLGNDHGVDAGMIKITQKGPWPHAELGKSGDLKAGQWCLTLGYAVSFEQGKPPALRIGRVLRNEEAIIVTDGTIMGGDSGGPLFDLQGKIIGIGSRCDDTITTNLYVPIDRFHDHWDRLAKGEDFNSRARNVAFLGVGPDEDADELRIGRVVPGSAAEKAGIKVGDVILRFDGSRLDEYAELPPLVGERKPGDEVEIEVRRGEKTFKVKATLGRRDG